MLYGIGLWLQYVSPRHHKNHYWPKIKERNKLNGEKATLFQHNHCCFTQLSQRPLRPWEMNVSLLVPPLFPNLYSFSIIVITPLPPNFHVFSYLLLVPCITLANFSMLSKVFFFFQFTHIKLLFRMHELYMKPPLKLFWYKGRVGRYSRICQFENDLTVHKYMQFNEARCLSADFAHSKNLR